MNGPSPYVRNKIVRSRGFLRFLEFFLCFVLPPFAFLFGVIGFFNNKDNKETQGLVVWYIIVMILSAGMTIFFIVLIIYVVNHPSNSSTSEHLKLILSLR